MDGEAEWVESSLRGSRTDLAHVKGGTLALKRIENAHEAHLMIYPYLYKISALK